MFKRSIGFILFSLILAVFFYHYFSKKEHALPLIAITQIIEHTTLDTVREGMIKRLAERGFIDGKTVKIVYQNAQGQMTTAAQIVQHFAHLNPKVLVALSTQSAQLLETISQQQHIPLVFTAVTDPVAAKLVKNLNAKTPGINGISDYMPPEPQIAMIKSFLPSIKTLGVLYNPSEVNSTTYLETFEKAAVASGITIVRSPLNSTNEAVPATKNLLGKVDAIYFPNDNTAMAAVSAIVGVAHSQGVPVFANDSASVEKGALAAVAYDRTQMGYDTADLVIEVLKKGFDLAKPIKVGSTIRIVENDEALAKLHMSSPYAKDKGLTQKGNS